MTLQIITNSNTIKLVVLTFCLSVVAPKYAGAFVRKSHFYKNKALVANKIPMRIVSLAPIVTEILFALELDSQIVGVTSFCNRPTKAKQKTKVGGFIDPQLEAILVLKPDLVIAPPTGAITPVLTQLLHRNTPILLGFTETLPEIYDFLANIGQVTHKTKEALVLLKKMRQQINTLKHTLLSKDNKQSPKVLLVISAEELIVAGPNTFAALLLTHMGANYVVNSGLSNWPIWPLEKLLRNTPDVIIAIEGPLALKRLRAKLAPILGLKQLKTCRLLAAQTPILMRPGIYLYEDGQILKNLILKNS